MEAKEGEKAVKDYKDKRHIPIELKLPSGERFRLQPGNLFIDTDGRIFIDQKFNRVSLNKDNAIRILGGDYDMTLKFPEKELRLLAYEILAKTESLTPEREL